MYVADGQCDDRLTANEKSILKFRFVPFQREINRLNLMSEDFVTGCMAQMSKGGDPPVFAKL